MERAGPADLRVAAVDREETAEKIRRRLPGGEEAVRDDMGLDTRELAQCVEDRLPRDAGAETAREHPVPDEALPFIHLPPGLLDPLAAALRAGVLHRQEPLLHQGLKAQPARPSGRRHDQGHRLGRIPHGLPADVEEPCRDAGRLAGPLPETRRRDGPPGRLAEQEKQGPCGIPRKGFSEITLQRLDLSRGLRRLVQGETEVGKALHSTPG